MNTGFRCALLSLMLAACAAPVPREPVQGHLMGETARPSAPAATIPAPVEQSLALPRPRPTVKAETYSVVVHKVPVSDLLFALARDAKVNVDIHPGITGHVSLNAIDQTLPQLLSRIAKQVDMRFELDGANLSVMPDSPFLKHYKVDYVNMGRDVVGTVASNSQIVTTSPNAIADNAGNVSSTRIENASKNRFWEQLEKNVKDILRETDKLLPEGSSETIYEEVSEHNAAGVTAEPRPKGKRADAPSPVVSSSQGSGTTVVRTVNYREAASVIVNPESGVVTVRATGRQHERIQEFLDRVVNAARRQVLIEATIVEVALADAYEQGIDWTRLVGAGLFQLTRASGTLSAEGGAAHNLRFSGNTVPAAAIQLLERFGTVKVLSSPRLSALNNQTALLKVVENFVYFDVKSETLVINNAGTRTEVTTTPQSVSVGLVLSVTPQISDNDFVILNIRPTISGISGFKEDPNPANKVAGVQNFVPQIRTREIESVMRVASGDIAVLGGLMEDGINYQTGRVPVLGQIPLLGEVVTTRNNSTRKSELVIFLRPVVIKDASLGGDYAGLRDLLPDGGFFRQPPQAQPLNVAP